MRKKRKVDARYQKTAKRASDDLNRPQPWDSDEMRSMKRELRLEAARSGAGNPLTSIKLKLHPGAPIERLRKNGKIGPVEITASEEMEMACRVITAGLVMRGPTMERVDRSNGGDEPAPIVDAVARYQRWCAHWAKRLVAGDRTLRCVQAAVIEGRWCRDIDRQLGQRHGLAQRAVVWGLRDYAVRAGWITGSLAVQWRTEAEYGWQQARQNAPQILVPKISNMRVA